MNASDTPRPYPEWRTMAADREEDAASMFGFHLMQHCRQEALKSLASAPVPASAEEFRTQVTTAVDTALHNVMDLLEGFWPTQAGPDHRVHYALAVCVRDASGAQVERIDISPCLIDLPIGYWQFTRGEFR